MQDMNDRDEDLELADDTDEVTSADSAHFETEAEVSCPYCGEVISITLDPSGGDDQDYVEDCEVCCRPWRVQVHYDETGAAEVWADANQ